MNCKPGVLAYVVHDDFPENIGRIVEVEGPAEPYPDDPGPMWEVRFVGASGPYSEAGAPGIVAGYDVECVMADADLRPISGVPLRDEQLDEVSA